MPNTDLTDVKIAIAQLEQVSIATAEASRLNTASNTSLSDSIKDLICEMKTRDVKNEALFQQFHEATDRINADMNDLKELKPVLLRSKKFQDNIDAMIRGIFSKTGFVILGVITVVILTIMGVDPSTFKFK